MSRSKDPHKNKAREKELEAERTAKRINPSEPGHQIADVNSNFDDQVEETPNEKGPEFKLRKLSAKKLAFSRRNMIIYSRHLKITKHLTNMSLPITRIKLDITQGCLPSIF